MIRYQSLPRTSCASSNIYYPARIALFPLLQDVNTVREIAFVPNVMSTSSEDSLVELPPPYAISSAVSRALRIESTAGDEDSEEQRRAVNYPLSNSYFTAYDFPTHSTNSTYNGENYPTAASYYCQASNPYYPTSALVDPHQYLYPHHYSAVHPVESQVQMEIEAWSESTAISICNNSSSELLESQMNMDQLDRFCKYIDSSGDEEFGEKTERNEYGCFISGSSPCKEIRKDACSMPYYEDMDSPEQVWKNWKVELENVNIWRDFDEIGTEMVITKAGR